MKIALVGFVVFDVLVLLSMFGLIFVPAVSQYADQMKEENLTAGYCISHFDQHDQHIDKIVGWVNNKIDGLAMRYVYNNWSIHMPGDFPTTEFPYQDSDFVLCLKR